MKPTLQQQLYEHTLQLYFKHGIMRQRVEKGGSENDKEILI